MILVTGGTGIVGSILLTKLIEKGETVRAMYRDEKSIDKFKKIASLYSSDSNIHEKIEWMQGDVIDAYSLIPCFEGVDYVYHCAGYVSFSSKYKEKLYKINVTGTYNVVNLSIANNIKKICHISSIAALSQKLTNQTITEENEWEQDKKNSWYSRTKYMGELEIWRGMNEGLPGVIVNPSVIIGAGNWEDSSSKLFSTVYNGLKFYTSGITGYVASEDVANAMIQLMESDVENERFILNAKDLSFKELFSLIAESLGKKAPTIKANAFLMRLAYFFSQTVSAMSGKEPTVTRSAVRSAFNKKYYSSEKIMKTIGFSFTPIENAIRNTGKLFLKQMDEAE